MTRIVWLLLVSPLALACGGDGPTKPTGRTPVSSSPIIPVTPSSCPDAGAAAGAPALGPDPLCAGNLPEVSFAHDVARLVACSGEVCHVAWRYDSLVDRASRTCCDHRLLVNPGQPSSSHLVQAVTGTSDCVDRMGTLNDDQIATIVAWICEGAPNN